MYEASEQIRVQWVWGNKCNFDCSYCPPGLHNNKMQLPEHEKMLEAVDYISRLIRLEGKMPCMEFTGGEPSQLPFLGTYLKATQGNMPPNNSLVTNGSASIEWFESIISFYNYIELSYHPGWSNLKHLQKVADFIDENEKVYNIVINLDNNDSRWIKGLSAYHTLKESGYNTQLKLLYSDFLRGNQLFPYKTYQLEQYYASIGQKFDPSGTEFHQEGVTAQRQRHDINKSQLDNNSYNFKGQKCYIGLEHLVVLPNGDVYRGFCKIGGKLGNVFLQNIMLPTQPIQCPLDYCRNGFDKEATKIT